MRTYKLPDLQKNHNSAGTGKRASEHLLSELPQLREVIKKDIQAAYDGDPAARSLDEVIVSYPGLKAITIQRLAHILYKEGIPMIPRIMTEYAHRITAIDIHPGATIGEGFFIDHGTGIVVGETTVIGDHVKLYQGVTLGALSTRGGQSLRAFLLSSFVVLLYINLWGFILWGNPLRQRCALPPLPKGEALASR